FDALGRTTSVWLPGRAVTSPASTTYGYAVSNTEPTRVSTLTYLRDDTAGEAVYLHSHQYLDGLGRARQAQTAAPGGTGREVTDPRYDSRGLVVAQTEPMYMTGDAGTGMVTPDIALIPAETRTSYDALGRVTKTALWKTGAEMNGYATSY